MNRWLRLKGRWSADGSFWGLVLLVLSGCTFQPGVAGPGPNFDQGPRPQTTLLACDVEVVFGRHCATDEDKAMAVRLAAGAVALNSGASNKFALDESPAARARCGGEPEAVTFQGPFPNGQFECLNGFQIGPPSSDPTVPSPPYATPDEACVARCEDYFGTTSANGYFAPFNPPDPSVVSFCQAHAHASTNVPGNPNPGFTGGCEPDGTPRMDFADPRIVPEPVVWTDLIGVSASGDNLTRTAATTGNFDAGAASTQWIQRGDAYVEFSANDTTLSHALGLSQLPPGCSAPCTDGDPSLTDITFGVSLNRDGRFYVIESSGLIAGPGVNGSFGTYAAGERFRVALHDNSDGTATVQYSRLAGPCTPGAPCADAVFYTHTGSAAIYPLRVDASFREQGAILTDVRVVRIQ